MWVDAGREVIVSDNAGAMANADTNVRMDDVEASFGDGFRRCHRNGYHDTITMQERSRNNTRVGHTGREEYGTLEDGLAQREPKYRPSGTDQMARAATYSWMIPRQVHLVLTLPMADEEVLAMTLVIGRA